MNAITEAIVTIALAIVGVAIVAAIISKNSNTTGVIQAAASGYANDLGVALSPVTGATYNIDTSYPNSGFSGSFGLSHNFGS